MLTLQRRGTLDEVNLRRYKYPNYRKRCHLYGTYSIYIFTDRLGPSILNFLSFQPR